MESLPLLLNADAAAELIGVSRSFFYGMHSSGRLGPMPVKFGKCSRWERQQLEKWVNMGCPARIQWNSMIEETK